MFAVVCKLGLDGIVSKKLSSGYKSGPSKAWLMSKIQSLWLQHGPLTKRFDRDTLCHWWRVSRVTKFPWPSATIRCHRPSGVERLRTAGPLLCRDRRGRG
jgi:hypothetical protein